MCFPLHFHVDSQWKLEPQQGSSAPVESKQLNDRLLYNLKRQLVDVEKQIQDKHIGLTIKQTKRCIRNGDTDKDYKSYLKLLYERQDIIVTIHILENRDFRSESQIVTSEMTDGAIANEMKTENLVDTGGDAQNITSAGSSKYSQDDKEMFMMNNFLSRPVDLYSSAIELSPTDIFQELEVWNLFTLSPTVRAKLRNYAHLRGDLHLRFAITATPFHYGKLLIAYLPYHERNDAYQAIKNLLTTGTHLVRNYLSQLPGSFYMDVRENKPLEFVCPFISTKQTHRLWNGSLAVSSVSAYQDLEEAGAIIIMNVSEIKTVNSSTDKPYLQVYGWMENVELGPPTATLVDVVTESKRTKKKSEIKTGPVENISSTVAKVSGLLKGVPVIGEFAMASEVVATSISKVASLFGWSKPPIIEKPSFVKNNAFQSPVVIGQDSALRLTYDPLQELTVDPRICGVSTDDLVFKEIASRWTLVADFKWEVNTPVMAPLYNFPVTPMIASVVTALSGLDVIQPSAMMFVAAVHEYWRGDIEVRLDFVISQFHRGKYLVGWEPNCEQFSTISYDSLNKNHIRLIDIQETQSVTFKIEWGSFREWLEVGTVDNFSNANSALHNGFVWFAPYTALVSPDPTAGVEILVSVRCPNLEVFGATMVNFPESRVIPNPEFQNVVSESQISTKNSTVKLVATNADDSNISMDHFGESVQSFRSLLKRYTLDEYATMTGAVSSGINEVVFESAIYTFGGPDYAGTVYTNPFRPNYFNYLRYAYLGCRGSVRKRINMLFEANREYNYFIAGFMSPATNPLPASMNFLTGSATVLASSHNTELQGQAIFCRDSNGAIEIELPFYSNNLFVFPAALDFIGSNPGSDLNFTEHWYKNYEVKAVCGAQSNIIKFVWVYEAAGEDFNFMRFQAAPPYSRPH